ncbi:MAG: lipoprotein insertase outer membrane protein LolB [Gammaproteobacteria bacterium]|nr:lipoprotein insertase outer membrane protein LolB [Gammaproteobacteria bacterium]MDH3467512.1 lipoprotein insertase outer membrane protein LolB [Gammaproteobacteria bacterium]
MSRRLLLATAALIAGCVTPVADRGDLDGGAPWAVRRTALADLTDWHLKARLGVRTNQRGGTATLVWDRRQQRHKIDLFGAFGGGRIRITQDSQGATLTQAKRNAVTARSADALLFERTGWRVPFAAMSYWIIGLPAPGATQAAEFDGQGRLASLEQQGWRIEYSAYRAHRRWELPEKITLVAVGGGQTDEPVVAGAGRSSRVRVKLLVKEWTPRS